MSTISQQLNSWITSENITSINVDELSAIDFSSLTTQSFASLTTADISSFSCTGSSYKYGSSSITYTIPSISALTTADIITISAGSGGGGGTGYTHSGSTASYIWKAPEEFIDSFPNFNRIQNMCEQYPGLKVAYDKFVTTYKMVKDDYDNPENKK